MKELLLMVGFIAFWVLLNWVILPRLGVST